MTELKQTEINFDEAVNETSDSPVFKLKVTNIRKSAYPTNSPVESDLFKFKVGDYVGKGGTAIYQVVSISREPIVQAQLDRINQVVKGYHANNLDLKKARELFLEYQKNGNFGACRITAKPVLKGAKEIAKGKLIKFLESDQLSVFTYNGYAKLDLPNIVKTRDYWIASIKARILKEQDKLKDQENMRNAVLKLMTPPAPVQTQVVVTQEVDLVAA